MVQIKTLAHTVSGLCYLFYVLPENLLSPASVPESVFLTVTFQCISTHYLSPRLNCVAVDVQGPHTTCFSFKYLST